MNSDIQSLTHILSQAKEEIAKVIVGQAQVIDQCLIAIFSRQHALIEGVPGLGKTLLVRTLAQVLGCEFSRIQFTPDLMPSDITGTHVFNLQDNTFSLVKGPIFTTFLLADEINRAPAKTQSALLQAMQEREVTIDRKTFSLGANFTVFATQNPIEFEGTYPLPEAQKDRFMLKILMDPPPLDEELTLANRTLGSLPPELAVQKNLVKPLITPEELTRLSGALENTLVKEELVSYAVNIVRKTRSHQSVFVGAGPRGTQALLLSSRVLAAIQGRDFVTPDDIKAMAVPTLSHRILLRPEYELEGLTVTETIHNVLEDVAVPR